MPIKLAAGVIDREGKGCGRISRLIANQSNRQIEMAVLHLNSGREILLPATEFSAMPDDRLRLGLSSGELAARPDFDSSAYYPLHPVEWQEEWGAVQGEILTLYPPQDIDRQARRRFILGSLAIMGAIAASLAYPVFRYLIHPLTRTLENVWARLVPRQQLREDTPVFIPYTVKRIEGYLEETITRGVWLILPSRRLRAQIARHPENLRFPQAGWANDAKAPVAFSTKCPHLGCNVRWIGEDGEFHCACHNSRFRLNGEVISGPAPRGLDTMPIRSREGGIEVMDIEFRAGISEKKRST